MTIMKIFTATVTTIGLLFLQNNTVLAETKEAPLKQYDVEIIIFEDAHARYINTETWSQHDEPASPEDEITHAQAKVNTKKDKPAVEIENINPKILTQEYKRINNSSEYEVLQYSAWRQQGLESSKAFDVELTTLKNSHTTRSENNITGTIKVVLARYLHLFGDLDYHRPVTGEAGDTGNKGQGQMAKDIIPTSQSIPATDESNAPAALVTEAAYPIEFRRRMRSKELHYIDHPLVGILVQINPVELIKEEAPENASAEQ